MSDTNEETQDGNLNSILNDGFDVIQDDNTQEEGVVFQEVKGSSDNEVPSEKLFDGPIVEGELPKLNAEFEMQADKAKTLSDVLKIQSDVTERGTISTEDIAQVDAIIPGFIDEENPIGQYTEVPSKTNLTEGLNNIDTMLEKQYDDLRVSIAQLCERYIQLNSANVSNINKKFYSAITDFNKAHAELLFNAECEDVSQVGFILNSGMRFSKFLELPVYSDSSNTLSVASEINSQQSLDKTFVEPYVKRIEAIDRETGVVILLSFYFRTASKALVLNRLAYKVEDQLVPSDFKTIEDNEENRYNTLSYSNMIHILTNASGIKLVKALYNTYCQNLNIITNAAKESAQEQSSNDHITSKLLNLSKISADVNQAALVNLRISRALSGIFDVYVVFSDMLKSLAEKQKPVVVTTPGT